MTVSQGGTFPVPQGLSQATGAAVPLLSNASSSTPAEPLHGGFQPGDVGNISIVPRQKPPTTSLSQFVQDFIAARELQIVSSHSVSVDGHPAVEADAVANSAEEKLIVFVERDASSVTTLMLELDPNAPNHSDLVSNFESVVAAFKVE